MTDNDFAEAQNQQPFNNNVINIDDNNINNEPLGTSLITPEEN